MTSVSKHLQLQGNELYRKGFLMNKRYVLLTVLSVTLSGIGHLHPTALAQAATQRIEVTAKRSIFEPAEVTLKKGQPVVLVVKSLDVAHGLRFRELNVDLKIGKGGTSEVQFTPETTGDFVGHCSVFCGPEHGSMTLTLHVVE
jgi:cytochrome c oxidase subunit 2